MELIRKSDRESGRRAARTLRSGGVVVLPTDTLYGFSATLSSEKGHRDIARLKGGSGRRFLYVAGGLDMVEHHIASWGCTSREEMRGRWPAPLTCVFEAGAGCPSWIDDTIAFRVPDDTWLCGVINDVAEPLLSTSVNLPGGSPLQDADEIGRRFGNDVELMVAGAIRAAYEPSTLVDLTGKAPRLMRRGAYDWPTGEKPSK